MTVATDPSTPDIPVVTFKVNDTITPSDQTSPATNPPGTDPQRPDIVIVYSTDLVLHAVADPPVPVVVQAPAQRLPDTGASPHDIVGGVLFIAIGVGCLLAQRIRRKP